MATLDPSHTKTLRQRFAADLVRRLNRVRHGVGPAIQRAFQFPSDARKVGEFLSWLQREIDNGVLEVVLRGPRGEPISSGWQSVYVRTVYDKALKQASSALRAAGVERATIQAAFQGPIHAETLSLLYTRSFSALHGITEAMSSRIAQELTSGLAQGVGPREVARRLHKAVDSIGIVRARVLARTELMYAHAEGMLNALERAGIAEVEIEVEILQGRGPCPKGICRALASFNDGTRRRYTIRKARGLLPAHPNCSCSLTPSTQDIRRIRAERQRQAA